jgi:predicted RNase H-like HicB family nuclease
MKYTLIYWKDRSWYVGRLKERPEVFSQGRTLEELEKNIKEALALLEGLEEEELPAEYETKEIVV